MFNHLLTNHTPLEKWLERVSGKRIEALPIPVRSLHSFADCPAVLLPWLAWERSVDYWRDDWSEQTKRDVIAASVAVHRKKGTLTAVRQAIAATGLQATVDVPRKFKTYTPHTFRVRVDAEQTPPTPSKNAEIRYQVDQVKPARCDYAVNFIYFAVIQPAANSVAITRCHESRQLYYPVHTEPATADIHHVAVGRTHLRESRA